MHLRRSIIVAAFFMLVGSVTAQAATVREIFTFDATLTSGSVFCGDFVGLESSCPGNFGTYSGSQQEDLVNGLSFGDTLSGQITLFSEDGLLTSASCSLGGRDCLFGTDLVMPLPMGPSGVVDFSETAIVASVFDFTRSRFVFGTDYIFDDDGVHYYSDVRFDLTDVTHETTVVPLPASVGFLLAGLAGFGALSLRRRRKSA